MDAKKLLEYQNAKRILDGLSTIEQEKLNKKLEKYEKDKVKAREAYHERVRKGGFEYLEKECARKKELYHLRKLKKEKDKEEAMRLEELRAERSKNAGNPFGKEFDKLKMHNSDSEDTAVEDSQASDTEGSAYCSTCPTTDTESVASFKIRRKKSTVKVELPEPPKAVQQLFKTFNFV